MGTSVGKGNRSKSGKGAGKTVRGSGNPANRADARVGYWHGGLAGLKVGDLLLPRASSGIMAGYEATEVPYDPNLVYVTTDRQLARAFACVQDQSLTGSLYNVRPVGELIPDPDYPFEPAMSFGAASAVVTRVVEARVQMTEAQQVQATGRWMTWPDGTDMYAPDGHLTLNTEWRAAVVSEERLAQFDPWLHVSTVATMLNVRISDPV